MNRMTATEEAQATHAAQLAHDSAVHRVESALAIVRNYSARSFAENPQSDLAQKEAKMYAAAMDVVTAHLETK